MAWIKKKVQGHLDSFRGEKKSGSYDKMNIEVKVQGPDDELHLSDLESSITSTQGDFKQLLQLQAKEAEEENKLANNSGKKKSKTHRRGRSDGSIFIKDKNKGENASMFLFSNNIKEQMENKGSVRSLEYKGSMGEIKNEFTNISFMNDLNKEAEESIDDMLTKWRSLKTSLEQNYKDTENSINQRRQVLIALVHEYANELQSKQMKRYTDQTRQAEKVIASLESAKTETDCDALDMTQVLDNLPAIPLSPLPELSHHSKDTLKSNVSQLFGTFQTIKTKGRSVSNRESSYNNDSPIKDSDKDSLDEEDTNEATNNLMARPEYIGKLSVKTSKDVRECGVTDMAFTQDKQILIVDKHNKMVKVFDTNGTFIRYIGKNVIKDPSRVTYLPWNNNILISDSECKSITVFNSDGAVIGNFADDLSSPVAHCVMPNQQLAVVNFDTKLVSIYTSDSQGGYRKARSFPTGLDCPAYITCTSSGNLVISDWSANKIRIYNTDGKFIQQVSKSGSCQGQISKPQGVHGDSHGNVFLGEKGNRRVQIFTEEGVSTFLMDKKTYDLGIPMSMDTTSDGFLIIAEYQGIVKFFKYLDIPVVEPFPVRPLTAPSKGRATAVVSPELQTVEESKI